MCLPRRRRAAPLLPCRRETVFTKDTDGKTITVDPNFFQTAMNVGNSDVSESEVYDITSKWMELREDDVNFVLDTIIEAS